ncbi:MAG: polyprenyl synthetase family protein [Alphaproteobacteria bacterium]|nr:polyprenyl synthetase family protein [Alphaproteobacteria bacterium]
MSAWPNLDAHTVATAFDALPLAAVERCMLDLVGQHGQGLAGRMAREHLGTGGKRLRAGLALASARALGVDVVEAVPWAAACELLHNASLVHDDLQDGDTVRRSRPTIWTVYGADQAINAGDLLLMLPTLAIGDLDVADALKWRLASCLARHGARTAAGQAQEMALRALDRLDFDSYLTAASGKTAGLFGLPVEGAALLAGHSDTDAQRLARPFEVLGLVYQLIDDVVDLYGDKGRNEIGADIREGKVSALVVAHLARHPHDRIWLAGVLRTPREQTTDDMVERAVARFAEGGALDDVLLRIRTLAAEVDGSDLEAEPDLRLVGRALRGRLLAPLGSLNG